MLMETWTSGLGLELKAATGLGPVGLGLSYVLDSGTASGATYRPTLLLVEASCVLEPPGPNICLATIWLHHWSILHMKTRPTTCNSWADSSRAGFVVGGGCFAFDIQSLTTCGVKQHSKSVL